MAINACYKGIVLFIIDLMKVDRFFTERLLKLWIMWINFVHNFVYSSIYEKTFILRGILSALMTELTNNLFTIVNKSVDN